MDYRSADSAVTSMLADSWLIDQGLAFFSRFLPRDTSFVAPMYFRGLKQRISKLAISRSCWRLDRVGSGMICSPMDEFLHI